MYRQNTKNISNMISIGFIIDNMTTTYKNIENALRQLDVHEKVTLAHAILKELDGDDSVDVEALWTEESERRLDAYLNGELEAVDGDEAMARLRSKLR